MAPHGIEGRLIYNCDLFERSTIERMVEDWYSIVSEVVTDPVPPNFENRWQCLKDATQSFHRVGMQVQSTLLPCNRLDSYSPFASGSRQNRQF